MDILIDIPGYKILEEIGRGGMSTVYRAVQVSLERELALKVMAPGLGLDPHFKQRFYREGQIVAQLSHPSIVTVFDIGVAGDRYFIAMEYVAGGSLEERIREHLTLEQSVQVIKPIAQALQYAHRRGYVHRDIKPSNILFRDDQFAVLADFGIAKALDGDNSLTKTGMTPGTPNYMSPEQIRGQRLDGRSDLYSLGVVFYQMLTGKRPYEADSAFSVSLKHLTEPVPKLPGPYAFLQPIIDRMLAKLPEDRFRDEDDFLSTLDEAIAHHKAYPASTKPKRVRPLPHKAFLNKVRQITSKLGQVPSWKWVGGAWVAALFLALVAFWFWEPGPDPRTQRIIEQLLAYAEQQIDSGQLTEPAGYNAYETYSNILEIAPRNKQAKSGLKRIADQFENKARSKREVGDLRQGLALVEEGLTVSPAHQGLLTLKKTIQDQIDDQERQQEIARLLAEATRQIQQGRLVAPQGDNAAATFQAVLELEAQNRQALQGLDRITQRLAQRAQSKRKAGELEASLALLEQGLRVQPGNIELQSLKAEVAQQRVQELRQRQIEEWLGTAENQLAGEHFFEPPGHNAYETYRQVLKLDPDNVSAQAGLEAIAAHYVGEARRAWEQEHLEQAAQAIQAGLKASPKQAKLLALRSQVNQKLEEEKEVQRRLAELLTQAQSQLAAEHYVAPEGNNAYATYQQVLALEPGHPQARAGLHEIVQRLEQKARAARDTGEFEKSLALLHEGLKVDPERKTLLALRKEVTAQQADAERRARIAALLDQAKEHHAKGHLTQPQEQNASAYYQQVLALDPDNQQARGGLERIKDDLARRARDQYQAHELVESLRFIEEALIIASDDPKLVALKDQVQRAIRQQRERQRQVEQLLNKAQAQLSDLKLTQPEGDNAYETYRQVLQLEPENKQAKSGLRTIAKRYAALAKQRHAVGDLENSLEYIRRGLVVFEDPELLTLRERVHSALGAKLRVQAVQELLEQAKQQLDADHLTAPPDDNAYTSYHEVLRLDPNNAQAQAGLQQIAKRFAQLAKEQQAAAEFEAGLDWVKQGLSVFPEHVPLQKLKTQLQRTLAARQQRQQQIENLLAQAKQQLDADHLTAPSDDNAYTSYHEVLRLDSNNAQAQAGLQQIAKRFTQLAKEQQAAAEFEAGLALVEQGLSVFPEHATLQTLKEQLADQEREKRHKEQLTRLSKLAESQFASLQLVAPRGDNAYETYQELLRLDPENTQARLGIQRIADYFSQAARERMAAGLLPESLALIQKGLTVAPQHPELQTLEEDLQRELGKDRQIKDLLSQAQQQLAALRLTTPKGDNAYETFRRVLQHDADNEEALNGLQQIADRYQHLAQRRTQENNLSGALVLVKRGLDVQPDHPGLHTLRTEIEHALEAQEQRELELRLLLARAEQQLEAGQSTSPPGNNAFETLHEALKIAPGNPGAKRMLETIAGQFQASARAAQNRGHLRESLSIVEEGLRLFPQADNLLALNKELTQTIGEVETLLVVAEQQLSARQLTTPPGANAYETLSQVLHIDPQNKKAREGLQTIPKRYAKMARLKKAEGKVQQGLSIAEEGLRFFPKNPQLLALREELQRPQPPTEPELPPKPPKRSLRPFGTF